MTNKFIIFFMFIILPNIAFSLEKAPPLILDDSKSVYSIGLYLDILEDKKGELTIDDVTIPPFSEDFVKSSWEVPNLGYTNSIYWIKFTLSSKNQKVKTWLLDFADPHPDHFELYLPDSKNNFTTIKGGDRLPFKNREIKNRNFIFSIKTYPNQDQTIYMRIQHEGVMKFPLYLMTYDELMDKVETDSIVFGIIYGIMAIMMFYNFFIFIVIRDSNYLFYVLYIASNTIFQMFFDGFAFKFFLPDYPMLVNIGVPFFGCLALFAGVYFTRNFLETKNFLKRLDITLIVLMNFSLLVSISSLIIPYKISIRCTIFLAFIIPIFVLISAYKILLKGFKPARYYAIAWTTLIIGTFVFSLKELSLIPSIFITEYSLRIGTVLDIVLLSFALADRINILKKEKENAQVEAINSQKIAIENLESARDAAKDAARAKSEFLANISHEIRTPMNAVIGLTELVLNTKLDNHQRNYLGKIQTSARSLLDTINDIFDFSNIEVGKLNLEKVNFYLSDILNTTYSIFNKKALDKGINLIINVENDVPLYLKGDSFRLNQVLINLLNNAFKFTSKGEVNLKVNLENRDENTIKLKFCVKDTGIGISKEYMPKLFDAFSQEDASSTREYGGTGLGLKISKRLVEMMGGNIWVESEIDKGSSFYFTSVLEIISDEKVDKKEASTIDLCQLKILVVDDNITSGTYIQECLRSFNLETDIVSSGKEALALITSSVKDGKAYNIVLMDWMMPEMDGIDVSKAIRGNSIIKDLPIIMMLPVGWEDIKQKANMVGVNGFIFKPVNQSTLFNTILEFFGRFPLHTCKIQEIKAQEVGSIENINGASILLVEDNSINQQVATEILKSAGAYIKISENGLEAVDAVSEATFDAILMDIQMPMMDGYEATKEIRKKGIRTPIIAVTAHAMKGDREKCLAAGMNDYVTKPIDVDELLLTLGKWIKPPKNTVNKPLPAPKKVDEENNILNSLPGIDIESGVKRLGGNRKLFIQLLKDFSKDYANAIENIKDAWEKGEKELVHRLVHTLKGVAGNFSAKELHSATIELERDIKSGKNENFYTLLEQCKDALIKVIVGVKNLKQDNEKDKKESSDYFPVTDISNLEPLLIKLLESLKASELDAEENLDAIKKYVGESNLKKDIEKMEEAILKLDFELAIDILSEVLKNLNR
ncbi:MAG: response regulator [Desulfobacterales bacterium]|nr:response regulator [Desulfobacterales bacterium]MBF0397768.1 response regulator [Desulfobacterales bacterium]